MATNTEDDSKYEKQSVLKILKIDRETEFANLMFLDLRHKGDDDVY